jgi:hypothetical protein
MESKKYTQFGTFIAIIMSVLLVIAASLLINHGFSADQETYLYAFLVLVFLACLLTFYKLTIIIDSTTVSFKLGIGLLGKSYQTSEIKSCNPVKNLWIYGVGIHIYKLPNSWLYNVSGSKAIELRFKDSSKVVRIGTNQPDEVAAAIRELTGTHMEEINNMPEYKIQSQIRNTIIFIAAVGAIIWGFSYYESRPITIDMKETRFEITGEYGFLINYNDISAIDTIRQMPNIEMRTDGIGTGSVCKGYFRLSELGNATLFINFKVSPFIKLVLKNGRLIYFNLKDRQSTVETFDKIKAKATLNVTK